MRVLFLSLAFLFVAGCAFLSPEQRRTAAEKIATDAGWQRDMLDTGEFVLATFIPPTLTQADSLTVYIEGDGMAWVDAHTPSFDPTPSDPVALQLALLDTSGHAVYLARPCQYLMGTNQRNCENKYWTSHRFAPEVIDASNQAIEKLKQRFHAKTLVLVGYSGGGAVATLIAARRRDVRQLVSVAGNLDIAAWAAKKRISPLRGSLNPADAWAELVNIPQLHFVGGADKVMPPEFAESYRARFPAGRQPQVLVIPEFDHHCCWLELWPSLKNREVDR